MFQLSTRNGETSSGSSSGPPAVRARTRSAKAPPSESAPTATHRRRSTRRARDSIPRVCTVWSAFQTSDTMAAMAECLFCKIRDHQIPARLAYEDPQCLAFHDINPQAPQHLLIVPRQHIETLNDLLPEHEALVGHLHVVAARLAREGGYADIGYRTLFNCNRG